MDQRSPEKPTDSALLEKPAPFRASQIILRLNSATDILPKIAMEYLNFLTDTVYNIYNGL